MITVDFMGFTGAAGEKKVTLGDSSASEDASLGQYGSLTNAIKASRKEELVRSIASANSKAERNVGDGSNAYIATKREQYL